jgi:ELWxxDGT repeat protein
MGPEASSLPARASAPGITWLFAQDADGNPTLWRTDGTTGGTRLIQRFFPTPNTLATPQPLVVLDGVLLFAAPDAAHGLELWRSDGTNSGTVLVHDLRPGSRGMEVFMGLQHAGQQLLVSGDDGIVGTELWSFRLDANTQAFGLGCGAGQPVALRGTDPVLGGIMDLRGSEAPAGSVALVLLGRPGGALALGQGCFLHLRPGLIASLGAAPAVGGAFSLPVAIPADASLDGAAVMLQAVLAPSATALGVEFSNGLLAVLGR